MRFHCMSLALLGGAAAFPSQLMQVRDAAPEANEPRAAGCSTGGVCDQNYAVSDQQIGATNPPTPAQAASAARQNCGALNPCFTFDATEQYVSTTGQHAYQSPAAGDIRGPCPGLNAAANHGYLPRNGVASLTQSIQGLAAAYGMGPDLSGFLAAYAIAIDGDLVQQTWSIGGPQQQLGLPITPGSAQGISWSHNKYEGDTSIGRCDAYTNGGDAHSLSTRRFGYVWAEGMKNNRWTMDVMSRAFTKNTFRSVGQNPLYFAPLFSTTLVSPAAYNFVVAMMSNHTAAEPGGYLDGDIFKTFFAITGTYPNFKWLPGQERIPNNWYRRPSATQYQAGTGVFGDLIPEFLAYPNGFRFGGNVHGVNSYEGINLTSFTGGAYNTGSLFQGNNFQCLVYQAIQQGLPDFLTGGVLSTSALNFLTPYASKALGGVSCPAVAKFNDNNIPPYPGHTYSPNGPATNC